MTQPKSFKITANVEEFYAEMFLVVGLILPNRFLFPVTFDCDFILIFPVLFDCDII